MATAKMPTPCRDVSNQVQTLEEIWGGSVLDEVRELHINGDIEKVSICKKCQFKETYQWKKI